MNDWYWRIIDPSRIATLAHGTAQDQTGLAAQIGTFIKTADPNKLESHLDGHGLELIIQGPNER